MPAFWKTLCLTILSIACGMAHAQAFPTRSLKIEVGSTAGGGTDVIARMFAERMGIALEQTIIIENKPGAANTIAADITAKSAPDGYTLLMANSSGQVIAPHMLKLGHDPLKHLAPIGMAVTVPHVIIVNSQSSFRSFADFIEAVKAKPDAIRYATSGVGSVQHMATEIFMAATGTRMTHIPYKGSSQAHQDILGGQVEVMFDTSSSATALIKSSKFRALAVTTLKRSAALPGVPTLAELGVKDAEMATWYAMYAPADTPAPVMDRLTRAFNAALENPDVQARLKGMAGEPGTLTREQFASMQIDEDQRFSRLIRQRNIKLE